MSGTSSSLSVSRRSGAMVALTITVGVVFLGGIAAAASNWIVGLTAGSTASAQAASITPLTIAQVTPVAGLTGLYPGGTGDVQFKITNPNSFPVTITALSIPSTSAVGFSDAALTTQVASSGCNASNSTVTWVGAAGPHTLAGGGLTVAANGQANNPLTVTLTAEAAMALTAPAACAGAFFQMPSLTAITATGGAATVTTSPAVTTYS